MLPFGLVSQLVTVAYLSFMRGINRLKEVLWFSKLVKGQT